MMARLFRKPPARRPLAEETPMNKIKMMVGQQGPSISRVPGQELVIGVDIGAEEAQRLVDGHLAAEMREIQLPETSTLAIAASTVATDALEPAPAEPAPAEPAPAETAPAPAKRVRVKKPAAQG